MTETSPRQRILILGGTRFVGRAIAEAALSQGHAVTLFNRGRTNPDLFPQTEKLRGDRMHDLGALHGRTWDVAIDVACYEPAAAQLAAEALADRVGSYAFISTLSVYADHSIAQVEDAEVIGLREGLDEGGAYGARKAACERLVGERLGGRALIARAGLIVGPHDTTDRFAYWPRRLERGGQVLAPGDPSDLTQFIDARDLANWIVSAAIAGRNGVFNVTGPALPIGRLLDCCKAVVGGDAELVWAPSEWLIAAGVDPWMGIPLWIAAPGWEGASRADTTRAVAAGLATRALEATIRDTLDWDTARGGPPPGGEGLKADQESALLARLRGAPGASSSPPSSAMLKSASLLKGDDARGVQGVTHDPTHPTVELAARRIPAPAALSEAARAILAMPRPPAGAYPALGDADGWRRLIAARNAASAEMSAPFMARLKVDVSSREFGGVPVQVARPRPERLIGEDHLVLDVHGGALLFGGGDANVRFSTAAAALRTGRVAIGIDYRVPPDHPFPAGLDDCVAVYRALIAETAPERIVVSGTSAGGNLAAALLLQARDEGLQMPAGAMLLTPELDLTESGDSFDTLMGLDVVLPARLTEMNLLYAGAADLADPYVSPLFGDVAGFPPTLLQAGTRDIFLSNAVRMHRKLRSAGVRAELHVWEGMPHAGFGGLTPEDREMSAELQAFIASL